MKVRYGWLVVAVLALAGCGDGTESPETPAAGDSKPAAASVIPPEPDAKTIAAYVAALKTIDPDIVAGKEDDFLVERGRDQCGSFKDFPKDQAKQIKLANARFTGLENPDGFGTAKVTKILAVVKKHLCPTY
ncbi:MAG TPA: hypothetical protein VGD43_23585 [Micromonospora sp.]